MHSGSIASCFALRDLNSSIFFVNSNTLLPKDVLRVVSSFISLCVLCLNEEQRDGLTGNFVLGEYVRGLNIAIVSVVIRIISTQHDTIIVFFIVFPFFLTFEMLIKNPA